MNQIKSLLIAVLIIIISGCASGYKIPLTQEFIDSKQKVNVGSTIAQKEIDARMKESSSGASSGAQFGALGVFIGSTFDRSVNKVKFKRKETQIAPLRDALVDFDFNPRIHQANISLAKSLEWLNINKTRQVDGYSILKFEEEQYFLRFNTRYDLSLNFDSLEVVTEVTLDKIEPFNSKRVKRKKNYTETTLFRNRYTYVSPNIPLKTKSQRERTDEIASVHSWYEKEIAKLDGLFTKQREPKLKSLNWIKKKKLKKANSPYTETQRNIAMSKEWAKNNAELVKLYLIEGLSNISQMVKKDIGAYDHLANYKSKRSAPRHDKGFQKVDESTERVILRSTSQLQGSYCSIKVDMDTKRCVTAN